MLCSMACTVQSTVICPLSMKMPTQKLHFGYNFIWALKIQPGSIFWTEHRNNMTLSNWLCATGCSPPPPFVVVVCLLLWVVVVRRRNLQTLPYLRSTTCPALHSPMKYNLSSSSLSISATCPALHSPSECHLSSSSLSFTVPPV